MLNENGIRKYKVFLIKEYIEDVKTDIGEVEIEYSMEYETLVTEANEYYSLFQIARNNENSLNVQIQLLKLSETCRQKADGKDHVSENLRQLGKTQIDLADLEGDSGDEFCKQYTIALGNFILSYKSAIREVEFGQYGTDSDQIIIVVQDIKDVYTKLDKEGREGAGEMLEVIQELE